MGLGARITVVVFIYCSFISEFLLQIVIPEPLAEIKLVLFWVGSSSNHVNAVHSEKQHVSIPFSSLFFGFFSSLVLISSQFWVV